SESRQSESHAAGSVINRLFVTEEHRLHLRLFEIGAVFRLMLRHCVIASLILVNSFVFTATVSAQMSSVEGSVVGADGRPLKGAKIRFEQKEGQVPPIVSRTDAHGRYAAALPRGTYKLSLATFH